MAFDDMDDDDFGDDDFFDVLDSLEAPDGGVDSVATTSDELTAGVDPVVDRVHTLHDVVDSLPAAFNLETDPMVSEMLDQMFEEIPVEAATGEIPVEGVSEPKRFATPATDADIDDLASERQAKLTTQQTRWAVKVFRGEC